MPGSLKPVPTGCSTNSIAKRLFHVAAPAPGSLSAPDHACCAGCMTEAMIISCHARTLVQSARTARRAGQGAR